MRLAKIFPLMVCFLLASCDDKKPDTAKNPGSAVVAYQDAKNTKAGTNEKPKFYEMVNVQEKIKDASYDLGYRDKTLAYPKLVGNYPENVKSQVNLEIEKLANTFKCRGIGDQSFTASITGVSEKLLSFKFEAMRMCAKSPGPDSTEGAYTYNLTTGTLMDLNSEFMDESAKKIFTARLRKKLTEGITQKEQESKMECPKPIEINYFFVTDTGLVVGYRSDQHYYSACTTEAQIDKKELSQYIKPGSLLLH